ncbi:MAG: hypothetical protein LBG31_05920 [Prevotellaceae bacterium]|nr:hypothetical protein [Prevotellaceae bacterium]
MLWKPCPARVSGGHALRRRPVVRRLLVIPLYIVSLFRQVLRENIRLFP